MVVGLDVFRDHFRGHENKYILIGGAACDLSMEEIGQDFRATKDLDIVLIAAALDSEFGKLFWDFIRAGLYEQHQSSSGRTQFYRFAKPQAEGYPKMLELFSRAPDVIDIAEGAVLSPIPVGEEVSSLSAILLDDDYYEWILNGKRLIDGVPIVGAEHLIPLKAKAWLDLTERKHKGENIDTRSIKKHRNDVFRLFLILNPAIRPAIPAKLVRDMERFLDEVSGENVTLSALGVTGMNLDEVLDELRARYIV